MKRILSIGIVVVLAACAVFPFVQAQVGKDIKPQAYGDITEYTIPTSNSYPCGIAFNSHDNCVYFTESNTKKIGKLTEGGSITEYTITGDSSEPFEITFNSHDNCLYFYENNINKIVKMTEAGSFSGFTSPSGMSHPYGIAFNSHDNCIYISETLVNRIGKITEPDPWTYTGYQIPTASSKPYGITFNSNDNCVYFIENGANKIGKMTETGTITEYAIPTGSSNSISITFNSNDNCVYFTETATNKIGKMTEAGVFTEYTIPTGNSQPDGITFNSHDYFIYFVEVAGNKIGKMDTIESTPPSVTIQHPTTGDTWYIGDTEDIEFTIADGTANYDVWVNYSVNGGAGYSAVSGSPFTYGSTGAKTEAWSIPAVTPAINCKIKVEVVDSVMGKDTEIGEEFTIDYRAPTVTVLHPHTGLKWYVGESNNIEFNITDGTPNYDVWINYSTNGGSSYAAIAGSQPFVYTSNYTKTRAWTIPNYPSVTCKVKVEVVDSENRKDTDTSAEFTIVAQPTVIVTSPVTGDIWFMEAEYNIAFTLAGGVANWKVWINYTVDGSYHPILGSQPFAYTSVGAKSKAWIVPSYTEPKFAAFSIKVLDTNNRNGTDTSDTFTIDFPPIPPPAPTTTNGITITFEQVGDWTGGSGGVTARTGEVIPIVVGVKTTKGVSEAKILYQLPQSSRVYEICIYADDGVITSGNTIGDMELTGGTIYNGDWSGQIPAQDGSGKIYYQVMVKDKDGNVVVTPLSYMYVLTAETTAPTSQPSMDWNLVIIAVVLISIALIGLAVWDYRRRR